MARNILFGRTDWVKDPAVQFFTSSPVDWPLPLTNMADPNPQLVAEAGMTDPATQQFTVDLGYERWVGAVSLINLRLSRASTIQVQLENQATSTTYDSGIVSGWPSGTLTGTDEWGNFTLTATYNPMLYTALGMPRLFVPPSPVRARYITISPSDIAADNPVQIGCVNAWETWERPINFDIGWRLVGLDGSDVQRVPFGSTYINKRPLRRGMDLGFKYLPEDEFLARSFDLGLTRGKSEPTIVIPFPEDTANLEKTAIYGYFSQEPQFANTLVGQYEHIFRIEQAA